MSGPSLEDIKASLNGKTPVKVYFLDASSKTFILDSTDTFDDLICQALSKFGIDEPEKMTRYFGIYESKDGLITNFLDRALCPAQVVDAWGDENYVSETKKMVLMVRIFSSYLQDNMNPGVVTLRYVQAVYDVITDEHAVTQDQAEDLAAMQLYVKFAAQDKSQWVPGFLTTRLIEFVPGPMRNKQRDDQWEAAILQKAKALSGTVEAMRLTYLKNIESNDHYGVTTYVCEQHDITNLPENVKVGVSDEGVSVWQGHAKQKMFELPEILRWGYHPKREFYIEVPDEPTHGTSCKFEMYNGEEVSQLLQEYAQCKYQEAEEEDEEGSEEEEEEEEAPPPAAAEDVAVPPPPGPDAAALKAEGKSVAEAKDANCSAEDCIKAAFDAQDVFTAFGIQKLNLKEDAGRKVGQRIWADGKLGEITNLGDVDATEDPDMGDPDEFWWAIKIKFDDGTINKDQSDGTGYACMSDHEEFHDPDDPSMEIYPL